jgi:hypothetical protein
VFARGASDRLAAYVEAEDRSPVAALGAQLSKGRSTCINFSRLTSN